MDSQLRSHLPQDEERLLQYLDGQLPEPERRAAEAHLAICAECQTLHRRWAQLDEQLSRLARPQLSHDFAVRLRQRVAAEAPASAAGVPAPESEGQRGRWPGLRAGDGRRGACGLWLSLLDVLGYGVAAAAGGCWLYYLTVTWLPGAGFAPSPGFVGALVVAGGALLVGLNLATRNRALGWLREL